MRKAFRMMGLALLMALAAPVFTSCGNDEEDVPAFNAPEFETVSGKYEISDPSSPYESIELGASGDYVVIRRGSTHASAKTLFTPQKKAGSRATTYGGVIYGTYTQLENGTFLLEGFGTLKLETDGSQQVTGIRITPQNGNEMSFSVTKAETMPEDARTNALCRTWKVVRTHYRAKDEYGEEDEVYTPEEEEGAADEIMFSKSGTALFHFNDQSMTATFWKWVGDNVIRFSSDNIWFNNEDELEIDVTFQEGKAIIHGKFIDLEYGDYEEFTTELEEKNPAEGPNQGDENENEGGENIEGQGPAAKVFKGKLPYIVDDGHGKDQLIYKNGFLTEVKHLDEEGGYILFNYYYLDNPAPAGKYDVEMQIYDANNVLKSEYKASLADNRTLVRNIYTCEYDKTTGEVDFEFTTDCEYADDSDRLIRLWDGREELDYIFTWENGNLTKADVRRDGSTEVAMNYTYGSTLNENSLWFFYNVYDLDIEKVRYFYWAGLLGQAPMHQITSMWEKYTDYEAQTNRFTWTPEAILAEGDDPGQVTFSFAE